MIRRNAIEHDEEIIRSEDAIAWPVCRRILRERWGASREEVAVWVLKDQLCAFTGPLDGPAGADVKYYRWCRGEIRFDGYLDEINADDVLNEFHYCRAQVECFNPAHHHFDSVPGEYRQGMFGIACNPSGRYLNYYQALAFLASCPGWDLSIARKTLERESRGGRLPAWHFTGVFFLPKTAGSEPASWEGSPRFADSLFAEAQILGIAKQECETDVQTWDAVSRPPWADRNWDARQFVGSCSSLAHLANAGRLPNWLRVDQIASLHPEGAAFADRLLNAHVEDALKARISADETIRNFDSLPRNGDEILLSGVMLLVHRGDLHSYLERYETWPLPVGAKLSGWWPEFRGTVLSDNAKVRACTREQEGVEVRHEPRKQENTRTRTTREDNLSKVLQSARKDLLKMLKREPSAAEVIHRLEDSVHFSDVVVDYKDGEIFWLDQTGKEHCTKRKTIENRLTLIRKRS